MDSESDAKVSEALALLQLLAQGERDIADGKVLSQEDFFAAMDRRLDLPAGGADPG